MDVTVSPCGAFVGEKRTNVENLNPQLGDFYRREGWAGRVSFGEKEADAERRDPRRRRDSEKLNGETISGQRCDFKHAMHGGRTESVNVSIHQREEETKT